MASHAERTKRRATDKGSGRELAATCHVPNEALRRRNRTHMSCAISARFDEPLRRQHGRERVASGEGGSVHHRERLFEAAFAIHCARNTLGGPEGEVGKLREKISRGSWPRTTCRAALTITMARPAAQIGERDDVLPDVHDPPPACYAVGRRAVGAEHMSASHRACYAGARPGCRSGQNSYSKGTNSISSVVTWQPCTEFTRCAGPRNSSRVVEYPTAFSRHRLGDRVALAVHVLLDVLGRRSTMRRTLTPRSSRTWSPRPRCYRWTPEPVSHCWPAHAKRPRGTASRDLSLRQDGCE